MEKETKLVKKNKGPVPVLTEKQIKFAELLIYEAGRKSPAECAFEAGYKTRPRQSASELRNPRIYPLVANYIKELRQEVLFLKAQLEYKTLGNHETEHDKD